MNKAIGIDLDTTYSAVAYAEDGRAQKLKFEAAKLKKLIEAVNEKKRRKAERKKNNNLHSHVFELKKKNFKLRGLNNGRDN